MIKFRLIELMAEKQFKEGRKITVKEVSESTGIHRATLSKMINVKGYSSVTDNLDSLCQYFQCGINDVAQFVPDDQLDKHTKAAA